MRSYELHYIKIYMMHLQYVNHLAPFGLEVSIRQIGERVKRTVREKANDVLAFKTKPGD